MKLADIRKDYTLRSLDSAEVPKDPIQLFHTWMQQALEAEVAEATAMCLSTLGSDGFPNARIVLLKGVDQGFVFFTNYQSAKGNELEKHPKAALTFFWPEIERQIRIVGEVSKISEEASDTYFLSRPYSSQLGAWASPQSQVIGSREELEQQQLRMEKQFLNQNMKRPSHWGGFQLIPNRLEFWQGRPSRLHDRIQYEYLSNGSWKITRLAP